MPTIRITQAVKDDLRRQVDEKRTSLQTQRKTKAVSLDLAKRNVETLSADLTLIDQQLAENLRESLAISSLRVGEYNVLNRFGDQKSILSTLFANPRDYVYVVQSRSGGKSHTSRWDEQTNDWRCDCESGFRRGYCWVTDGIRKGVKLDKSNNPYIVDEQGRSHEVARFLRQV